MQLYLFCSRPRTPKERSISPCPKPTSTRRRPSLCSTLFSSRYARFFWIMYKYLQYFNFCVTLPVFRILSNQFIAFFYYSSIFFLLFFNLIIIWRITSNLYIYVTYITQNHIDTKNWITGFEKKTKEKKIQGEQKKNTKILILLCTIVNCNSLFLLQYNFCV